MRRWNLRGADWIAFDSEEWDAVETHVHTRDLPETESTWREPGAGAGFGTVRTLYTTPTDLFRVFAITA